MLEWLLTLDRSVFLFINQSLANPVTDLFMPVVTNDNFLRGIYAVGIVAALVFGRKRLLWAVLFSIVLVTLTDQTSASVLKPLVGRLRPCKIMEVHLLVNCGSGYSFPSSHAANLFGQALFWGLLFRRYLWPGIAFAFIIGLSRIFVGVHYPLDVLTGMILGALEGAVMAWIYLTFKFGKTLPRT
jgi:undecaprenyl-diphosphatase